METDDNITGLVNEIDPNHEFVFRSAEYGTYYQYWYQDNSTNYWLYSNAPIDDPLHDPFGGQPIMNPNQAVPHENPEFYTAEGFKRAIALPSGVKTLLNQKYNPKKLANSWYEYYLADSGDLKYVYLDKDVKENLELHIQYQIRVVDAGLTRFRKFAAQAFQSTNERDKTIGCILLLTDQAYFSPEQLIQAKVSDIDFIDETVYLLGRKFRCDVNIYDYLTSLAAGRSLEAPLFSQNTLHGSEIAFGPTTISSIFAFLRVSSVFLPYWHATHLFSKIVNKLYLFKVPSEEVQARAFMELANTLGTSSDVRHMVDFQVVNSLMDSYSGTTTQKSLQISGADDFGVATVYSDLIERRGDELSFSQWLHSTPLHTESDDDSVDQEELVADAQESGAIESTGQEEEDTSSPLDNDSEESISDEESTPV